MTRTRSGAAISALLAALLSGGAFAQTTAVVQRNINQQQRIQDGLRDGSLTTREAARLERGQGRVERMESRALRDGSISGAEQHRITDAQNRQSRVIHNQRNDAQRGDPHSVSSQRMQRDVGRNIVQQQRIENGIRSGQLTNREVGRLERGASRINRMQAHAGRDGHVGRVEQQRIDRAENRESRAIHHERHDGQRRGGYQPSRFDNGRGDHGFRGNEHGWHRGRG